MEKKSARKSRKEIRHLRNLLYRNRKRIYAIEKLGGKCVRCGNTDYSVLEFHHRIPEEKTANIAWIIRAAPKMLDAELDKCDLLCRKCHYLVTYFGATYAPVEKDA